MSIDRTDAECGCLHESNGTNKSNILQFMKKYHIANYQQLLKKSVENIEWYWNAINEDLSLKWYQQYNQVFDTSEGFPKTKWFLNGKCNIVYNAVDRNAKSHPDKIAYIFENETGICKRISYSQLAKEVNPLANACLTKQMQNKPYFILPHNVREYRTWTWDSSPPTALGSSLLHKFLQTYFQLDKN